MNVLSIKSVNSCVITASTYNVANICNTVCYKTFNRENICGFSNYTAGHKVSPTIYLTKNYTGMFFVSPLKYTVALLKNMLYY